MLTLNPTSADKSDAEYENDADTIADSVHEVDKSRVPGPLPVLIAQTFEPIQYIGDTSWYTSPKASGDMLDSFFNVISLLFSILSIQSFLIMIYFSHQK